MADTVKQLDKDIIWSIKKFLAFALRHKPFFYKVKLDKEGFADLTFTLKALNRNKKLEVTKEQLIDICRHHSGGIFKLDLERDKIKAKDGHSVIYNMNIPDGYIEATEIPGQLHCAIHRDDIKHMNKLKGLTLANKQIILSKELPVAEKNCLIITIDSNKARRKKVKFYQNHTNYFSRFVPLDFVTIHV